MTYSYIAGFFDGEGCICVVKGKNNYHHLQVWITQRSRPVLEQIRKKLGCGYIQFCDFQNGSYHRLVISHTGTVHLCRKIKNHVVVKNQQVKLALRYEYGRSRMKPGTREKLGARFKILISRENQK